MAKAKTDIRSLARSHTESAINTLKGIMNQTKAPAAARVAAATALLDRGWGKPKQEVEHSGSLDLAGILQEIDGQTRGIYRDHGYTDGQAGTEEPTIQ